VSYVGALEHGEYSTSIEKSELKISVSAFFNKSLPFDSEMDTSSQMLKFKGTPVMAFANALVFERCHRKTGY
jgi:hypothetical protein